MNVEDGRSPNRLVTGSIQPILVPMALGSVHAGVDLGAAALERELRRRWQAKGLCETLDRLQPPDHVSVTSLDGPDKETAPGSAMYLQEIASSAARQVDLTRQTIESGRLALTLGGDHAVAIGSVAGASMAARRLAVIWIDAHADLNWPEVSPSGHIHGMPLGASLGRGPGALTGIGREAVKVRNADTYLFGVRDLDPSERDWISEAEIHCTTMATIDERGLGTAACRMIDIIRRSGTDAVHLSFDVDVLDPAVLPGTGTPVRGGLSFREAARLLRLLRDSDLPIRSLDWVELNPILDPSGASLGVAAELLAIALGEETI